jgi:hypothetical protein
VDVLADLAGIMAAIPTLAEAEELAASITWLASSDASSVNGVILPVDGGGPRLGMRASLFAGGSSCGVSAGGGKSG